MPELPSHYITDFRGRPLPEPGVLAGYAAIIEAYSLKLPLPRRLTAVGARYRPLSTHGWSMVAPRLAPEPTLEGHLVFALKREGVDLPVLAQLFAAIGGDEIADIVRATPTGSFSRRLWFLYEWLTDRELDLPNLGKLGLVRVVDPQQQFALDAGEPSVRHKVINNLPGTPAFCPMVWRTPALEAASQKRLDLRARDAVDRINPDLVARAAAFMLLNDSKSSFAIEGERPSGNRTVRWGQAIAQAGSHRLTLAELDRLQRIVIGDARFVPLGLRTEGGFVGVHDRDTNDPIPDHISARHQDLQALMQGLVAYADRTLEGGFDPVVAASALAFGFVYIHPYADGNGRLHRWLIHHVLAAAHYNPPGLIFPISAAILRRIDEYRQVLQGYSHALLPEIEWSKTVLGNVDVHNETADFYRYFDASPHSQFLYECVEQTIVEDLPEEVRFLKAFDRFNQEVQQLVDMPTGKVELLRKFLAQHDGRLSGRARDREFAMLTDAEAAEIERIYRDAFDAIGQHATDSPVMAPSAAPQTPTATIER